MFVFFVVVLGAATAYVWLQNRQFEARIDALLGEAVGSAEPALGTTVLPDIVRDYAIRAGGMVGGPSHVHLQHRAMLTTDRARPPINIEADQWLASYQPNLVWRGRGSMFGVPVTVVDSFVNGAGFLEARLAGAFRAAGGSGPAFDKGELQRYLSELPVHPDAILNNTTLSWRQVSDDIVEVSGPSNAGSASVKFFFDEAGDIVGLEAADRPMSVGKITVPTPWKGTFSRYKQFGRYRIPSHGEVGWVLPEGLSTYWRGEVTTYEALSTAANERPAP